jgi:hypothetical protein
MAEKYWKNSCEKQTLQLRFQGKINIIFIRVGAGRLQD